MPRFRKKRDSTKQETSSSELPVSDVEANESMEGGENVVEQRVVSTSVDSEEDWQYASDEYESSCSSDDEDAEDDDLVTNGFVFEDEKSSDFTCLSPEDIVARQQAEVVSIASLLEVSKANAAVLLKHYQWKKERLLAEYFENPDKVLEAAGCDTSGGGGGALEESSSDSDLDEDECNVCGAEFEDESVRFTALSVCGHKFCNECWSAYLSVKVGDGEIVGIPCQQYGCSALVDDKTLKSLVPVDVYSKYARFVSKSFVDDNAQAKWCPRAGCGHAITSDMISKNVVTCACGYRFCFSCHRPSHVPATCQQMKDWDAKCQDDSETHNWLSVNARPCPKCEVMVEKNGGCNHMQCYKCKYDYCWICMRPWKGHNDYYNCNRFDKEKARKKFFRTKFWHRGRKRKEKLQREQLEREQHRDALVRYLHYYERFSNHAHSMKMEGMLKDKVLQEIRALETAHEVTAGEHSPVHDGSYSPLISPPADSSSSFALAPSSSWADLRFVERAVDDLLACRAVLGHSYVVGYYLPERETNSVKRLFEDLQEDLEKSVEKLSEVLSTPGIPRVEAVNMTNITKTKMDNLIKFSEDV